MLQTHRDLFVGTVANALNQDGYFGYEINLYSFLLQKDEKIICIIKESEEACVQAMLSYWMAGNFISDYCFFKQHIDKKQEMEKDKIYQEACKLTMERERENFENKIDAHKKREFVSKETLLEKFFKQNENLNSSVKCSILGECLRRKYISENVYHKWEENFQVKYTINENMQTVAGFAWKSEDGIKYYVNSYIPNVWRRWSEYSRLEKTQSAIYIKQYEFDKSVSPDKVKESLLSELRQTFSTEYFNWLEEIFK